VLKRENDANKVAWKIPRQNISHFSLAGELFESARVWTVSLQTFARRNMMIQRLLMLVLAAGLAAGCSNTIRGAGQDTANVVNATQSAGQNVGNAAAY